MFIHYLGFYTALNLPWNDDGRLAETKCCATCRVNVDKWLVLRHGYFLKGTSNMHICLSIILHVTPRYFVDCCQQVEMGTSYPRGAKLRLV